MKKIIILLAALFMSFMSVKASHMVGAEIWYEHVIGNTYDVHLRIYRDCSGINLGPNLNVSYQDGALPSNVLSLSLDTSYSYTDCYVNACNDPSSQVFGVKVYEYSDTITLPNTSANWVFSFLTCCRAPVIVNATASNSSTYIEARLDNSTTPINNSAYNPAAVKLIYGSGLQNSVNVAPIDTDGDSLDIYFVPPAVNATSFYSYLAGYSTANPFGSTIPPVLDPQSGTMTFTLPTLGVYIFGIKTDEYRNGVLIASTMKDFEFRRISGAANNLPTLSGVNNSPNYYTTINACPNSTLTFSLNSADLDATDSTKISANFIPSAASFTTVAAQNETGTFTWPLTVADARSQPYVLSFKVEDDNCGDQSYGYLVYVNQCNTDSVWAGDANADFTCNNYDVLSIGIANGSTGPTRVGATTNWQAEYCALWPNSFISNINYRHADCNGDGVVNNTDLAAVTANYGQVHMKQANVGQYKTAGFPDLYCNTAGLLAERGTTVSIPVMLGTSGAVMLDFYGISGTVELLNAQTSAPISINNNGSWIGTAANSFAFEKSLAPNKVAFTFVRNDQQNIAVAAGQIGMIEFPIDANSLLGSEVIIQFSDLKLIDKDGMEIEEYNVLSDTLTIVAPTGVSDLTESSLAIYPNPTRDYLNIDLPDHMLDDMKVSIYLLDGRLVRQESYYALTKGNRLQVGVKNLAAGQYILKFTSANKGEFQSLFIKQ